jgi:hypothetical protein
MLTREVNRAVDVMDTAHGLIQFVCDQPGGDEELGKKCGNAADAYRSAELAVHIAQRTIDVYRETGNAVDGMHRAVSRVASTVKWVVESVKGLKDAYAESHRPDAGSGGDGIGSTPPKGTFQ